MLVQAAVKSAVSAFEMHSPKSGIVGETERKSHLQLSLLKEWSPSVGIVDEITELIPTERSEMDNDAGASRAVHGTWLSSLSDESRRGKTMIVGTTNCPWRFSQAFFTRFLFLPVLYPLPEDFPEIVSAIAGRITGVVPFEPREPVIQEAAKVFYQKGATPRQIYETFSNAARRKGELNPELILWAAKDLTVSTSLVSTLYTDFWALKACSQRSFLPWSLDPKSYPYPEHLKGVVDQESGDIITTELNKRIDEYKPFANV
jgi:hypothetical protein